MGARRHALPHLAFTDLSAYGNDAADLVAIPYGAPVPFAVAPTRSPAGRAALEIDFYGAHNATTWLSHRPTAKVVREVTIQQVATDHLRLCVELKGKQLWGYQCDVTNNAVVLTVRRPPKLRARAGFALQGADHRAGGGSRRQQHGRRGASAAARRRTSTAARWRSWRASSRPPARRSVIVRKGDESISLRSGCGAAWPRTRTCGSACTPTPPATSAAT